MRQANVRSIEAIRHFKTDLQDYQQSLRQSLDMLYTELNRAVEYLESDRGTYWPAQVRRASDAVASARINLERCRVSTRLEEGPSCYEEQQALQRAKTRLATANEKVKTTRKHLLKVRQEVDQFKSRLSQLNFLTDTELPRAVRILDRLAARLDRYVAKTSS